MPLNMPVPRYPVASSSPSLGTGAGSVSGSSASLACNRTAIALHLTQATEANGSALPSGLSSPEQSISPHQPPSPAERTSLLKFTDETESSTTVPAPTTTAEQDRRALERDLAGRNSSTANTSQRQGSSASPSSSFSSSPSLLESQQLEDDDIIMTEEERRDQLERERKATVISNLEEQRKMIGTPNGHLLEGDLSLDARLDAILATSDQEGAPFPVHGLDEQIADNMIENCIG